MTEEDMDLLKAAISFIVVFVLLNRGVPLYAGMMAGTGLLLLFFKVGLPQFVSVAYQSLSTWDLWHVILALYIIEVLQHELKHRDRLKRAQSAMNQLFLDQRLNAVFSSILIGMMPAPTAVSICGEIMDHMAEDYLTPDEKACCATYYRHIPEGFLPTFPTIVIVCGLGGVAVSSFVLKMIPMVIVLILLGFLFYLHKVPRNSRVGEIHNDISRQQSFRLLLHNMWSIFASIAIILIFRLQAWQAVLMVVLVNAVVERFSLREVKDIFRESFDWKIIVGMMAVFVFKDVLIFTGVMDQLPTFFLQLPIPAYICCALLFFAGGLIAGSDAAGITFTPLAFRMLPGRAEALVLLMGFAYCASQISPTHICLPIIAKDFHISLGTLVRKTLPLIFCYAVVLIVYYHLLLLF